LPEKIQTIEGNSKKNAKMVTNNKVLLRFLIIFFGIYIFPFPLNLMPFLSDIVGWINEATEHFYVWTANNVLTIETGAPRPSGSGDTHYDYIFMLVTFLLAVLGTAIWSITEKRDKNYKKINYWFWTYLRFFLAAQLVVYGLMKVFPLQMPSPTFNRLIQPFGEFSPMGLAWSYVGFSPGYEIFVGASELLAGLLLLHRRTTLLGGLLSIIVMSNVAAINFFFDVPVKLFSVTLVLISMMVVSPQIGKLFGVMFGTKPVQPLPVFYPINSKKWNTVKEIVKWTLVVSFLIYRTQYSYDSLFTYGPLKPRTPLYGLYEIEVFKRNGIERPPLVTDSLRWRYLISEYPQRMTIYNMKHDAYWVSSEVDTTNQNVKIQIRQDTINEHKFNYMKTDSTLIWEGTYMGDTIYFKAKRLYKEDFPLMNRGFNWVQEYPYNR
jgi:uncharacterized membrane protein YphA (DoxX/SURF4 family)